MGTKFLVDQVIGAKQGAGPGDGVFSDMQDVALVVSGTMSTRGGTTPGTVLCAGDVVVSGSFAVLGGSNDVMRLGNTATTPGGLYYMSNTGVWANTQANGSNGRSELLAVAMGGNSGTDGMLLRGYTTLLPIGGTADHGVPIYVDAAVPGGVNVTAPSGTGNYVRLVGWCTDDSSPGTGVYFSPSNDWVELS